MVIISQLYPLSICSLENVFTMLTTEFKYLFYVIMIIY